MNDNTFNLLLVDDDPDVLSHLKRVFRKSGYKIFSADNGKLAVNIADNNNIDAAVVDMRMPDMTGIEVLSFIKKKNSKTEVIILTGHGAVETAVEAIKAGATDFIEKPAENELLLAAVANIAEKKKLEKENEYLKEQMDFNFGFEQLVGISPPMLKLKKKIKLIGPSDASVLITGETGTGKELIARAVHRNSGRANSPFVAVDCASINANMIESELFGHIKGAFTGAVNASKGLVRAAETGTLFLDEIGELPLNLQSKLLRVIQQREVRPIGGTQSYPVDIRILAASNRDLLSEVEAGNFREDLFYRLNVVNLIAPPLRERGEDLHLLSRYFLDKFSISDKEYTINEEAMTLLSNHSWPGNIRELENIIRRVLAFSEKTVITRELIMDELNFQGNSDAAAPDDCITMDDHEKNAILKALDQTGGKRSAAAELLKISEATLYRKLKKYSLSE